MTAHRMAIIPAMVRMAWKDVLIVRRMPVVVAEAVPRRPGAGGGG